MNIFNWLKKKSHPEVLETIYISPLVEKYIDLLNKEPERFCIEYCTHHSSGYHIQVRDRELGFNKDAWFYVRDGEYWYESLSIGGVTICRNLADTLNIAEIRAIYHAVKNIQDKLQQKTRDERLKEALGKYQDAGSK